MRSGSSMRGARWLSYPLLALCACAPDVPMSTNEVVDGPQTADVAALTTDALETADAPDASDAAEKLDSMEELHVADEADGRAAHAGHDHGALRLAEGDLVAEGGTLLLELLDVLRAQLLFLVVGRLVGDDDLQAAMIEHRKSEPNMRLYLRADKRVKFAVVKRAMTACAAAGVMDVIFATYEHDYSMKGE